MLKEAIDWVNHNEGFTQVILSLLLIIVSYQLYLLEKDRNSANFSIRYATERERYDIESRDGLVFFSLSNTGGMASPPDPNNEKSHLMILKNSRIFGLIKTWEKLPIEIFTQDHYSEIERLHRDGGLSIFENIGRGEIDTTLKTGQINSYIVRYYSEKPILKNTKGILTISPLKGRKGKVKVLIS